eukprot:gene10910-12069_t
MNTSTSAESSLNLTDIDSGMTLSANDLLLCESEQQQVETNCGERSFRDLKEIVFNNKAVVKKYKKQTCELQNEDLQAEKEDLLFRMEEQGKRLLIFKDEMAKEMHEREQINARRFKDLQLMQEKFQQLCLSVNIKNSFEDSKVANVAASAEEIVFDITAAIAYVSKQVRSLVKENAEVREENAELHELNEFMQYENQFTIEELKSLTENNKELKNEKKNLEDDKKVLEKEIEEIKEKNHSLEEKNSMLEKERVVFEEGKPALKENADTDSVSLMIPIAKFYRASKMAAAKLKKSLAHGKRMGKLAMSERQKRISLARKYKKARKQNERNGRSLAMERKMKNAYAADNLDLKCQIENLSSEIKDIERERPKAIQCIKEATIELLKATKVMEMNKNLKSKVNKLKNELSEKEKDLISKNECLNVARFDLTARINSYEDLKVRVEEMAANEKKMKIELEEANEVKNQLELETFALTERVEMLQARKRSWYRRLLCGSCH